MLKTKIKASGITNLTDARYFAAREVEWLGFRFGGDPATSISLLAAKAIAEWVDGVKIVGEFDFATAEDIKTANDLMHFDAVQVGMFTSSEELKKLPNLTCIKEVVVTDTSSAEEIKGHFIEYQAYASYFLLDFTKAEISWEMLKAGDSLSLGFLTKLFEEYQVILALDFLPEEADEVLASLRPSGFSLSGGEEEKIGLKSFEELDEILDSLEMFS